MTTPNLIDPKLHEHLFKHLAAGAALETVCGLDFFISYDELPDDPTLFALGLFRGALSAVVASHYSGSGQSISTNGAKQFLPVDHGNSEVAVVALGLDIQRQGFSPNVFQDLLSNLDEVSFQHSGYVMSRLSENAKPSDVPVENGCAFSFSKANREAYAFGGFIRDLSELTEQENTWGFWLDWLNSFFEDVPLNWELQRRVALISDAEWRKGPEHIARLIEEIRARFELEKRIAELEAERQLWDTKGRYQIGGNNPPERMEDPQVQIVQEIIWAPIEDLKSEIAQETPDRSAVQNAIAKLFAALVAVGKWTGGKVDKAANAFAIALGTLGAGSAAGWIAQNSNKIAEIIQWAQTWLKALD